VANDWIVQFWKPEAMELGLQHLSQVLAPGIYGQMSFHQLHQQISDKFEIKMFEEVALALEWLLKVAVPTSSPQV
jgi:hypothetical protein